MSFLNSSLFCCNKKDKNETFYSIAIKKPNSVECYFWDSFNSTNIFQENNNINNLINFYINKTNQQWENYLIYNDELPNNCKECFPFTKIKRINKKGHCKGVLFWNDYKIAWLIHSVPKFPYIEYINENENILNINSLPNISKNELIFGQSFIYYETDIKFKLEIFKQLSIIDVQIYYFKDNTSKEIISIFENTIKDISLHKFVNKLFFTNNILHISKSHLLEIDIYEDFLTYENINIQQNKIKLLCETWVRGKESKESENIIHIKNLKGWKETQDHSKWCISNNLNTNKQNWFLNLFQRKEKYRVFIGDLNCMTSQFTRGGGGIVIDDNKELWLCFHNLIKEN